MADKITGYPNKTTFADLDELDFSSSDGFGGYISEGATWLQVKNELNASLTTLYNSDGTLSGDRTVNQNGNYLNFTDGFVGFGIIPNFRLHSADYAYFNSGFGSGGGTIDPSAIGDLISTTKGFLIPRMTTAQRNAIISPATGLEVYNLTTSTFNFYDGSAWQVVGGVGVTNLSIGTTTATTIDVDSDSGTDATIPAATISVAGLLQATDKVKVNILTAAGVGNLFLSDDGNYKVVGTPTPDTGVIIDFAIPKIFNLPSSVGTGNVTDNLTGALIGNVQKIYHEDTVAPTFPANWILIADGVYFPNELNIIYAEFVDGTRVEYTIVQEQ